MRHHWGEEVHPLQEQQAHLLVARLRVVVARLREVHPQEARLRGVHLQEARLREHHRLAARLLVERQPVEEQLQQPSRPQWRSRPR